MKYDLVFEPPVMNAAGSLGFAPDSHGPVDLAQLGAFVTNPVSLEARSPAQGAHFIPYHGGFLLHTGHPNPGLKAVLRHCALRWERSPLPVIVHLLCQKVEEMPGLVRRLEGLPGVMGLELGLPPRVDVQWAVAVVRAAAGELPLIVRLPFERSAELALAILAASNGESGLAAFSLGPPHGALPAPGAGVVHGRLYGPAVFPQALAAVQTLQRAAVPLIASGGVYRLEQVELLLAAGARAVQLDAVLWRGGWLS